KRAGPAAIALRGERAPSCEVVPTARAEGDNAASAPALRLPSALKTGAFGPRVGQYAAGARGVYAAPGTGPGVRVQASGCLARGLPDCRWRRGTGAGSAVSGRRCRTRRVSFRSHRVPA